MQTRLLKGKLSHGSERADNRSCGDITALCAAAYSADAQKRGDDSVIHMENAR